MPTIIGQPQSGGGGTDVHNELTGRNASDAHPTSAITGLDTALAGKQSTLVSGTNIKTVNGESLLGAGNVTVSGAGATKYLFAGCTESPYLKWWSFNESTLTLTAMPDPAVLPSGPVRAVTASKDGTKLLVGFDQGGDGRNSRIYNMTGGTLVESGIVIPAQANNCLGVAFSADGNFVALAYSSLTKLRVLLLDPLTECTIPDMGFSSSGRSVAFSPDGLWLIAGGEAASPSANIYARRRGTALSTTFTNVTLSFGQVTQCRGVAWLNNTQAVFSSAASDGNSYLQHAVRYGASLEVASTTMQREPNPAGNCADVAMQPGGAAITLSMLAEPWANKYKVVGTRFVRTDFSASVTNGACVNPPLSGSTTHAKYDSSGLWLAMGGATNGLKLYRDSDNVLGAVLDIAISGGPTSVCWWPKAEFA